METQSATFRQLALPIAFGVVSIVLAIGIWLSFRGPTPLAPHSYRATLVLPDATDLYPGSDVTVSGVRIGRVIEIERQRGSARVRMEIEPRFAPLRQQATAIKRSKSLLGEGYVEIATGPKTARPVPDGGELPRSRVRSAQSLDAVLETFEPRTRADLRTLFGGLAGAFAGRARSLSDVLGEAAPTSRSLTGLLEQLDAQRSDLRNVFARSGDVLTALAGRESQLQAAITAGNRVLDTTARGERGLKATVGELPPFLDTVRHASRQLGEVSGELSTATAALRPVIPRVTPATDAVVAAAPEFTRLFKGLPGPLAAGRRGLPAASAITRAAGSSFGHIHPASRELIPSLQLLAELRGSMSSFFANIGSMANTRVNPDDPLQTSIGAMLSVWNETVAGWRSRLPTNRPNPYPKPSAPFEIGNGLLSYDCRHLRNPLWLPATGLKGAMPCRLQGPWTFNGANRYYPRLSRAAP